MLDSKKEEERKKRNKDLVRRMRDGENLAVFNSDASWFPPRPVLKHDLAKLLDRQKKEEEENERLR